MEIMQAPKVSYDNNFCLLYRSPDVQQLWFNSFCKFCKKEQTLKNNIWVRKDTNV